MAEKYNSNNDENLWESQENKNVVDFVLEEKAVIDVFSLKSHIYIKLFVTINEEVRSQCQDEYLQNKKENLSWIQ